MLQDLIDFIINRVIIIFSDSNGVEKVGNHPFYDLHPFQSLASLSRNLIGDVNTKSSKTGTLMILHDKKRV